MDQVCSPCGKSVSITPFEDVKYKLKVGYKRVSRILVIKMEDGGGKT